LKFRSRQSALTPASKGNKNHYGREEEKVMRNRISRLARKLTVAALISGLTAWLPLPAWHVPSSASAQTANGAQGQELPSQMKVSDGRVYLEVDDTEAVYPVMIDPTFTQRTILRASGGADSR
jgi:hypothetical protein